MRFRTPVLVLSTIVVATLGQLACHEPTGVVALNPNLNQTRIDSLRISIGRLVSRDMSNADSVELRFLRAELKSAIGPAAGIRRSVGAAASLTVPSRDPDAFGVCTVTRYGPVDQCSITVDITPKTPELLLQSSFPSRVQKADLRGVFSKNVIDIAISGDGAISCDGPPGTLIGFDSTGAEVARTEMKFIDESDCGQDRVTFGAQAKLETKKLIRSITIKPPQPWDFSVNGVPGGHATAYYTLAYNPPEHVEIRYEDGTPTVSDVSANGDWAPLILPAGLSSTAQITAAGKPPTFNDKVWPDSLILDVGIDSSGKRAAGRTLSLAVRAIDEDGLSIDGEYGHIHTGANGVRKSAGTLSRSSVTTDAGGHSKVIFRPSIVSGPVILSVRTAAGDSTVDTLRIGVSGLVSLSQTTHYDLVGSTEIHPSSFWVSTEMAGLLNEYAESIFTETDSVTHFNDSSLKYGGKFDLNRQWAEADATCFFTPEGGPRRAVPTGCHSRHRLGRDTDLRTRGFATNQKHRTIVRDTWETVSGLRPVPEGDHFHLPYRK